MERRGTETIDLIKLAKHILKYIWLVILCALIGFSGMYVYNEMRVVDTYTASSTMYVYNGNPNVVNYQYTSTNDLNSAVQLLDTYMVVIKSDKVMDVVSERLSGTYPGITNAYIASTLSMGSVSDTGVLKIKCTTTDPKMAMDICNAVMDVAPSEIIRVVSAGSIEIIDYAVEPTVPNGRGSLRKGMMGGLAGAALAGGILVLLFLLNTKVRDDKELTDAYTVPILSSIPRAKSNEKERSAFLIDDDSKLETLEAYGKLRMNLAFSLVGKTNVLIISSSVAGEGKSTISANLAVSYAKDNKKVLLIDADMRRANQSRIFKIPSKQDGLSDILVGKTEWKQAVVTGMVPGLSLLPAGRVPPNPSELLNSTAMRELLVTLGNQYDIVLMDTPPINIVTDPLVLSDAVGGMLMIVRENFSDHREIRKSLKAAEMTGMDVLGIAFYGENVAPSGYYHRKYYSKYYRSYENKRNKNQ